METIQKPGSEVINAYKLGLQEGGEKIQPAIDFVGSLAEKQDKTNELLGEIVELLKYQNMSHNKLRSEIKQIQDNEEIRREDLIYEKYAKKLEKEHSGEYVTIGPDGETIIGEDDIDVVEKAVKKFGAGNFVFRIIGCRYVGALI